jgi:hypothetical protein
VPDFETRSSPPEPGRLSKLRTSAVAIMKRHRRATGLAVSFVVVLAVGCTVYGLQLTSKASEPWPPEYRLGVNPESEGYCYVDREQDAFWHSNEEGYYCVVTAATDEKSLKYISRKVYLGSNYASIEFYDARSRDTFAKGYIRDGDTVRIAYWSDN